MDKFEIPVIPAPVKLLPKRENMAMSMLQHSKNKMTKKRITEEGLKFPKMIVLPQITRSPQITQPSPDLDLVPPTIHTQQGKPQQPTIQNNFTNKGFMTEQQHVTEKGMKFPQQTVLPQISRRPRKTQLGSSPHLDLVPPTIHTQKEKPQQPAIQNNFTKKGIMTEQQRVRGWGLKFPQQTVLPQISRRPRKTQLESSPYLGLVPPTIHTQQAKPQQPANQQQGNMKKRVTTEEKKAKNGSEPKEKQKVEGRPNVPLTPEIVLRKYSTYLTDYELEEVKKYKEVWYLGKKVNIIRNANVTGTKDDSGFDSKEGFYKVILNDHLAYRFEVLEAIGEGYSAQVLKCMDHKTKELVAIKVIRNKNRFHLQGKSEVKILDALRKTDEDNTANIVHMKEHFHFRNHLCITFELLEKNLCKALNETNDQGFNEKEIRKYTIDMLKCLHFLQKKMIIHGDIKPENILLNNKDSVMHAAVGDFGGSCFIEHYKPLTHTRFYMSPEMLLGKICSTATDMWSLGCVLAELYRGRVLFDGCDYVEHFSSIMKVLGPLPTDLLVEAPNRNTFFGSDGIPWRIKDIWRNSGTLAEQVKSKDACFLDFIERCLEYDPTKRITPEEALQHPWIQRQHRHKKHAGNTRPDTTMPISIMKHVLLPINKKAKAQMWRN